MDNVSKYYGELNTAQSTSIDALEAKLYNRADAQGAGVPHLGGSLLWEYTHDSRIYGVPVARGDRGLPVDSDDLVQEAFQLDRKPHAALFVLDPASTEGCEAYNKLLDRLYLGEVAIIDEDRQFDATNGRFVVWVRYDELCYSLNNRFDYLRDANV